MFFQAQKIEIILLAIYCSLTISCNAVELAISQISYSWLARIFL